MSALTSKNTVISVALIALVAGVAIGVAGTELKTGALGANKVANAATNSLSATNSAQSGSAGPAAWNPFEEMRDMQLQIDRMFDRMSSRLRNEPQLNFFKDNPGYALSFDVRDLQDHFEVRAYLPDTRTSEVKVSLPNDRTLRLAIGGERTRTSSATNLTTNVTEWNRYEQTVDLPAPVKIDQMKIERKDHELLVTLPKAQSNH